MTSEGWLERAHLLSRTNVVFSTGSTSTDRLSSVMAGDARLARSTIRLASVRASDLKQVQVSPMSKVRT